MSAENVVSVCIEHKLKTREGPPVPQLVSEQERGGCRRPEIWILTIYFFCFSPPSSFFNFFFLEMAPADKGVPSKPGYTCWLLHCVCLHLPSQYNRVHAWLWPACLDCIPEGQFLQHSVPSYQQGWSQYSQFPHWQALTSWASPAGWFCKMDSQLW